MAALQFLSKYRETGLLLELPEIFRVNASRYARAVSFSSISTIGSGMLSFNPEGMSCDV